MAVSGVLHSKQILREINCARRAPNVSDASISLSQDIERLDETEQNKLTKSTNIISNYLFLPYYIGILSRTFYNKPV